MGSRPALSFIIPARNAASTVGKTLDSLVAQRRGDWEAVVVDDGSTDGTAKVVADIAARDARVRLVRQANGGVSSARNAGVAAARGHWLCMLDADDVVDPRYAELMLAALKGRAEGALAYCWFQRVAAGGTAFRVQRMRGLAREPLRQLAVNCACPTNSFVLPRRMYLELGGMDPSLRTCEDWDLWIRVARSGADFIEVPYCLAFYRITEGSLTLQPDLRPLLRDGLTVLERMSVADPRVPCSLEICAEGVSSSRDLSAALFAVWCVGKQAATGQHPDDLFALLPKVPDVAGREDAVAGTLIEGLRLGCRDFGNAVIRSKSEFWRQPVDRLFEILENGSSPGLKRRLWLSTIRFLARRDRPPVEPWKVGSMFAVRVELANIVPVFPPEGCDCGVLVFVDHGVSLAVGEVAVTGSVISPDTVVEVAARSLNVRRLLLLGLSKIASADVRRLLLMRGRRLIRNWRSAGTPRRSPGTDAISSPRPRSNRKPKRSSSSTHRRRSLADLLPVRAAAKRANRRCHHSADGPGNAD